MTTYKDDTTTGKVNILLIKDFNKVSLSEEIGISRPTLDVRLEKDNWKKSEVKMVSSIYQNVISKI